MGVGLTSHRVPVTARPISGRLRLRNEFPESDDTLADYRLRWAC